MNIKIIVATHKKYRMPDDKLYLPIQAGAALAPPVGFTCDNIGENISEKNPNYCELTALYWAWKNLDAEYIGIVHYRRHFCLKRSRGKWESILTNEQAQKLCSENSIILPEKRRYFIETNYSHYIHAHKKEGLDLAEKVIAEKYPQFSSAYKKVMNRTSAHMFNMMIMKRDKLEEYCYFLFDVLSETEKRLDISGYDKSEARVFGYIGEVLLDVWLEGTGYSYKEIGYIFMEKQNWLLKGGRFLERKFRGRR